MQHSSVEHESVLVYEQIALPSCDLQKYAICQPTAYTLALRKSKKNVLYIQIKYALDGYVKKVRSKYDYLFFYKFD